MEKLLNKLIEKGWKPRGLNIMGKIVIDYDIEFAFDIYDSLQKGHWNFRELVSKESGLWQFVCDNKMEKKMEKNHRGIWINSWAKSAYQSYPVYTMERYEYRIIESSLKDESELEDFLLSNIKIDGTTK